MSFQCVFELNDEQVNEQRERESALHWQSDWEDWNLKTEKRPISLDPDDDYDAVHVVQHIALLIAKIQPSVPSFRPELCVAIICV